MYDKIMFIDFDGTITKKETLDGSMKLTIDPDLYKEKHKEMLSGKITLSEALHIGFNTVPSDKLPVIMDFVRTIPIRDGFLDLLKTMKDMNIPVVVISGGLKPYIEEKLEPYKNLLLDIYSVDLDCSGPYMRLVSDFEKDGEIMQKPLVMAKYDYKHAICIGDSYTDFRMACASQLVFARDVLSDLLKKQRVPFESWEDFNDIKGYFLKQKL
jgi:2-hydroxy-3-keto-5-methylthiopentenyl-1-phosphate phosphatase